MFFSLSIGSISRYVFGDKMIDYAQKVRNRKKRLEYCEIWGIPDDQLKGPIYVRVQSIDDYHKEEYQRIFYYRTNDKVRFFFEVRVQNCYQGKDCDVCTEKEKHFFNDNPNCLELIVHRDEVYAEFDSMPNSLSVHDLSEFLHLNILEVQHVN